MSARGAVLGLMLVSSACNRRELGGAQLDITVMGPVGSCLVVTLEGSPPQSRTFDGLGVSALKHVKAFTRGTFPRRLNRRLSHWLYNFLAEKLAYCCQEHGIRFERKAPWKTSQFCRFCQKWDRRNRRGDLFVCRTCGHTDHADVNAAHNLAFLGLAGVYGLRSLQTSHVV